MLDHSLLLTDTCMLDHSLLHAGTCMLDHSLLHAGTLSTLWSTTMGHSTMAITPASSDSSKTR